MHKLQHRRPQVYPSSGDTCVVDALASRSCSQDGAEGKSSLSLAKSREQGASRSVSADGAACDFTLYPLTLTALFPHHRNVPPVRLPNGVTRPQP